MGVVSRLNENKKVGVGVGAALIIIAVGLVALQLYGGNASSLKGSTKAFYTDDNGKSFFKDDISKIPPFDHNGKQALRADVFRCEDNHEFVGLVYRFTDMGKKQMTNYLAQHPRDPEGTLRTGIEMRGMQVKKVGADEKAWAPNDEQYTERLRDSVRCPQGNKPARLVVP